MPSPRRTVTSLRAGLAAAGVLLAAAACGDLDQAASAQGIARNDLVSEVATQLGGSATRTFTATYRLRDRAEATVAQAQNPPRTRFEYPGGQLLATPESVTACKGLACTETRATGTGTLPDATYAPALQAGLVAPATVVALLTEAALDTAVTVEPTYTTIAGHHATCVDVANLSDERIREFQTCVTSDGVLGSFTGTLDGRAIDLTMTDYAGRTAADAFTLPAEARITPA